jgi:molecular chaperone HscB
MKNHFELFHLAPQFALDMSALDAAYREVQNRVHPDKFVSAGDAEKRVAMQWATRANEAYQTLKNPLKRATYMCELHGVDLRSESNTAMPMAFLMQQMEWREALEDARMQKDVAALGMLESQLRQQRAALLMQINAVLDAGDYHQAAQDVRQMMFLEKFGEDVSFAFEASEI